MSQFWTCVPQIQIGKKKKNLKNALLSRFWTLIKNLKIQSNKDFGLVTMQVQNLDINFQF